MTRKNPRPKDSRAQAAQPATALCRFSWICNGSPHVDEVCLTAAAAEALSALLPEYISARWSKMERLWSMMAMDLEVVDEAASDKPTAIARDLRTIDARVASGEAAAISGWTELARRARRLDGLPSGNARVYLAFVRDGESLEEHVVMTTAAHAVEVEAWLRDVGARLQASNDNEDAPSGWVVDEVSTCRILQRPAPVTLAAALAVFDVGLRERLPQNLCPLAWPPLAALAVSSGQAERFAAPPAAPRRRAVS